MGELLTVKNMSDRLIQKFSGESPIKISRSIQHWTNVQLLLTDTQTPLHRGSGRHRLYPLEQLYRAAILCELTPYSIQVGKLRLILDIIDKEQKKKGLLKKAAHGQKWIFCFGIGPQGTGVFGEAMEAREFKLGNLWEPIHIPMGDGSKVARIQPFSMIMIRLDYLLAGL